MPRQPLYPHIPKSRQNAVTTGARTRTDLRFLPDSPEFLAQTVRATGYGDKLATVFQEAIARARRRNDITERITAGTDAIK
jgi:hypothetical protein